MVNKGFKCPSCDSNITESKYYEILRISDEKKKFENELKKQLDIAKKDRDKLAIEKKNIQKKLLEEKQNLKKEFEIKFEKQKSYLIKKAKEEASKSAKKDINKAKKEGVEKGIEKQKANYGILVTFASSKDKSGFWIERDILSTSLG